MNKTGGYGDSPLFKAALHGRTEMIRTLLDAGEFGPNYSGREKSIGLVDSIYSMVSWG